VTDEKVHLLLSIWLIVMRNCLSWGLVRILHQLRLPAECISCQPSRKRALVDTKVYCKTKRLVVRGLRIIGARQCFNFQEYQAKDFLPRPPVTQLSLNGRMHQPLRLNIGQTVAYSFIDKTTGKLCTDGT
jgi:hypothetical protein